MKRVLVTRPAAQALEWVLQLRQRGLQACALPLIDIDSASDAQPVLDAWQRLPQCDLAVFVSPNAVERFFAMRPGDAAQPWPVDTLAASPGPGTDSVLARLGVPDAQRITPAPDAVQFDSESLWQRLRTQDWQGRRVLIVRGDGGREWLATRLREAGAEVELLAAYTRLAPTLDDTQLALLREALRCPDDFVWFFSSSEAIDHLERMSEAQGGAPTDWSSAWALATHPRIAGRARRLGCGHVIESAPMLDAVVAALTPRCGTASSSRG